MLKLKRILPRMVLVGMFMAATATPVMADLDAAKRAYQSGDFTTALREFTPLAEQGGGMRQHNSTLV